MIVGRVMKAGSLIGNSDSEKACCQILAVLEEIPRLWEDYGIVPKRKTD
jgi:hypothetical protein